MLQQVNSKLINYVIIVSVVLQLITSIAIIALQLDALNARRAAISQREETLKAAQGSSKQNKFIICILRIQPEARDDTSIGKCESETLGK